MEFRKINSFKLRVLLSNADCRELGIRMRDGEPCGRGLRDAVRSVISAAETAVGFVTEGERLLVQLYPRDTGGAEMLVTGLSGVGDREREALSEAKNLTTYQERRATFRFTDLDVLSRAAALSRRDTTAELYSAPDGSYYLALSEELVDGFSDLDLLSEFGTRIGQADLRCLGEHLTLLFSDIALSTLAKI